MMHHRALHFCYVLRHRCASYIVDGNRSVHHNQSVLIFATCDNVTGKFQ